MAFEQLTFGVGPGQSNLPHDIRLVQQLLNKRSVQTGSVLAESGRFDQATEMAIRTFQRVVMRSALPDGVVAPDSSTFLELTLNTLNRVSIERTGRLQLIYGDRTPEPSPEEYAAAGSELHCEVAVIKAVQRVEAPRGAWDDVRQRPTILFERHLFSKYTGGRFDAKYPSISNYIPGGYGVYAAQYSRLEVAYALDANAALRSASWGLYQILGNNFADAGFGTVNLFVNAMCMSVSQHLNAYVSFIKSSHALWHAVQTKNWTGIALHYNGTRYRHFHYDQSLADEYEEVKAHD